MKHTMEKQNNTRVSSFQKNENTRFFFFFFFFLLSSSPPATLSPIHRRRPPSLSLNPLTFSPFCSTHLLTQLNHSLLPTFHLPTQ
ncbi:hypothetical protein MtrunA17_Chr3g0143391 [Medicago truncatula]|uniref:Uncharacterized protein n=1 Tax=Medicago truncatula TaxID=3880 RepID=A0A396IZJ3_MEDTR|nr:hypothetical protein MtrunA17_Chr3g0143391 [Medicago truncatula]